MGIGKVYLYIDKFKQREKFHKSAKVINYVLFLYLCIYVAIKMLNLKWATDVESISITIY